MKGQSCVVHLSIICWGVSRFPMNYVALQKVVGSSHLLVTPRKRAASYREELQEQYVPGEPPAGTVVIWIILVELGRISHSRELCSDEVLSRALKSHKCSLWISIGSPTLGSCWQWSNVNQKRITMAPGYPKTLVICPLFPSTTERRGSSEERRGIYHAPSHSRFFRLWPDMLGRRGVSLKFETRIQKNSFLIP